MSTPHVTIHRGRAGLAALEREWRHATTERPVRFFCEWGWWDAYLSALDPEPERVLFVRIVDSAGLVAIVPLRESRELRYRVPVRALAIPRHDHLPLAGVLHRAGLSIDALLAGLVDGLRDNDLRWDTLELGHLLEEGVFATVPQRLAWRTQRDHVKTCDEVRCGEPWETYAAKLSPNFRSNLNKAGNKLAKTAAVRYAMLRTLDDAIAVYPRFAELEASGWKGEAGTAIAQDPRLDRFYRRLLERFAPLGRVRVNTLEAAGKYIAAQLCLVDGRTIYVFKLAYDEAHAKLAPGNMLLRHVISSGEFDAVNLVGSPAWFAQWKPAQTEVYRLTLYNTTARGALLLGAARARRYARPLYHRLRIVYRRRP